MMMLCKGKPLTLVLTTAPRLAKSPTGRGTPDDADVVQGRPADEETNPTPAPTTAPVQPWDWDELPVRHWWDVYAK